MRATKKSTTTAAKEIIDGLHGGHVEVPPGVRELSRDGLANILRNLSVHAADVISISGPGVTEIEDSFPHGPHGPEHISSHLHFVNLTSISFPAAKSIGRWAFTHCPALTAVDFPIATRIGCGAFESCTSLVSVSFPAVTTIGVTAFARCTSLTTADFPVATRIGLGQGIDHPDGALSTVPSWMWPFFLYSNSNSTFAGCTSLKNRPKNPLGIRVCQWVGLAAYVLTFPIWAPIVICGICIASRCCTRQFIPH